MKTLRNQEAFLRSYLKIVLFFLFAFCCIENNFSQLPNWQWSQKAGASNSENGTSVTTDSNGNVYVTGYFFSPVITFGNYTLTNSGNYDVFIVKYNPSGNVLWAKSFGGIYDDVGYSIVTNTNGDIFITGYYYSASITIGSFTLTNSGGGDIFIAKYDAVGNVIWAKSEGGNLDENSFSIATDVIGNCIITGYFKSTSLNSGAYTLTNTGNDDLLVIKYDALGNTLWAKSANGSGKDSGNGITIDESGNIYITGLFYSSIFTIDTFTITNSGSGDAFVTKLDALGDAQWVKKAGGTFNDAAYGVTVDQNNNIYVIGTFYSSTISVGSFSFANMGDNDIFIVKYDDFGNEIWAKSFGGLYEDSGLGITTDVVGNIYVTGHFHSPSITIGTYTLSNTGVGDIYIAEYDTSGNTIWAVSGGGTSDDGCASVAVDLAGNVFVTGYFFSPSITFAATTLINAGSDDMFLAKLMSITTDVSKKNALTMYGPVFYPNPNVTGEIYIDSNQLSIKSIEVTDVFGSVIIELNANQLTSLKINLSNQPKGLYFITTKTEHSTYSNKLIIH